MAQIAWRHGNEQRDAKYFVIGSDKIVVPAPSDSDLKSFYDSHPQSFSVPERRTVAAVAVTPDSVAPSIAVKDDELAKEYDKRKQKYAIPERRRIQRIPFHTLDEAQKARARIMQGTPFATIATDRGFTDKDTLLDKVSKEEMRDPAVADVAFALKDGEVSQPVQGRLSLFLVKASNIEPGRERSFDEVKDALRNEVQVERARDVIIDLHGKIEDGRGGGATLEEVARENKLPLKVFGPMDRNSTGLDGKDVPDMPVKSELLKAAFESDVGVDNEPISTSDDGFIWYEVREVKPAQRKPFDVAKPEVAQAWTDQQRREKLTEAAKGLVKRAEQGTKFEDLAREQASEIKTQNGLKRGQCVRGVRQCRRRGPVRGAGKRLRLGARRRRQACQDHAVDTGHDPALRCELGGCPQDYRASVGEPVHRHLRSTSPSCSTDLRREPERCALATGQRT